MSADNLKDDVLAQDVMMRAGQSDHSPCVGDCTYDAEDLCRSCRRHNDEIATWRDADEAMRRAAWARIPAEIDKAGIRVMRLPLSPDDIAERAIACLDEGGAWAVGGDGHWVYAHDLTADDDGVLTAASADGAATITLDLSGKMRALAWSRGGVDLADGLDDLPVLIVVPRARIKDEPCHTPTVMDDGRTDLGYGIPSLKIIQDGDDLVLKTLLAEARVADGTAPAVLTSPIPEGLSLPDSYVLAAVILPKGEASL